MKDTNPHADPPTEFGDSTTNVAFSLVHDSGSPPGTRGMYCGPLLHSGASLLSADAKALLEQPLRPRQLPAGELEASACAGADENTVRGELSSDWESDPERANFHAAVVGALAAIDVVARHSGATNERMLTDGRSKEDPETETEPTAPPNPLSIFWRGGMLLFVLSASLANGTKLVLLAEHDLFKTILAALALSAVFSVAPVVIFEWATRTLITSKSRRRLERILQAVSVPAVVAGLAVFAASFGQIVQDPIAAMAEGRSIEPNWGLVILANLVTESFVEIALWGSIAFLRGRKPLAATVDPATEPKITPAAAAETALAEAAGLKVRLEERVKLLDADRQSYINRGVALYRSKVAELNAAQAEAAARVRREAVTRAAGVHTRAFSI